MTDAAHAHPDDDAATPAVAPTTDPLLAEDVLLVLLDPASGTIGGEGTLFYVLGGAVLVELGSTGAVTVEERGALRGDLLHASGDCPADEHLQRAWQYLAEKPRAAQTVLAAVGPHLREPLLERLVQRGDVVRETRKVLGPIRRTVLEVPDTSRRAELVARLRAVLVDGVEPDPRTGAIGALVAASGALPTLDREIPWGSAVANRAEELKRGDWGASAAAEAVTRTMIAITVGAAAAAVSAATAASQR
ncbi:GOLPH3/VPS74 family protein [Litorihabitans aurantiacus]|uniref:GPP34 family phosphoprotein n=1 Tax=Litorihabitans aurantiacus TaxID=1930061 RepID=A0AA38CVK5_9MICO|nr:GPP34 family phosphoprotein [Litorihabitans aurantiacus]GMA33444.1 hypothetical protein GCM10025875_34360 [Litorihabitans aurantiacus]